MKIGGGGWVTGMDLSNIEKGLRYIRTDVSGAYRWNPVESRWKQIVTTSSMPEGSLLYGKLGGVDSLVSAPSDPKIAYMAFCGKSKEAGEIYKSVNQGDTWTATGFRSQKVEMEANGPDRQTGERLGVDPANSKVVYFGSRSNGLWMTENGGENWSKVQAIPEGSPKSGVTSVVFDKNSGITGARTKTIFVTVDEGGIYKTADAGKTWTNIAESGPENTTRFRDAEIGPDSTFYVASRNSEKDAVGSVWKYSPNGTWTNITPSDSINGGLKAYADIAVDPFDPDHIVVMISGGKTFVSRNQGETWSFHLFKLVSPTVEWQGKQTNHYLSVGEISFDPFEAGTLVFAEGFGVWTAKDLSSPEIEWTSLSQGIEEMCGNDVIAPPGGKPIAAMWDLGAFYFRDVDSYTAVKSHPGFMSAWALDWCPADPKFIVGVFRSHLDFVPIVNPTGFSNDGGQTWNRFPAVDNKTLPKELQYGVIAVSAHSIDNIVWCPNNRVLPFYTTDKGTTWNKSVLEGTIQTGLSSHSMPSRPLCADRVLKQTFYFFTPTEGVFRSTDGGATFAKMGHPCPGGGSGYNGTLKATIGHAGHLWFAEGIGRGAWRSIDGGASWTSIQGFKKAYNIGLGKPESNGRYPTIFIVGVNNEGETGIFRSTDEGLTWSQIADAPLGITDYVDAIDGDKDTFGKVYIGFAGAGFAYGEPK